MMRLLAVCESERTTAKAPMGPHSSPVVLRLEVLALDQPEVVLRSEGVVEVRVPFRAGQRYEVMIRPIQAGPGD
jgi:hypothetical protein